MASIRIVDSWLRSPAASPVHHRAVMVVAEAWAEQRVLMRAFAHSPDQTRPTIVLHGLQLAIGPAGLDPHGPWGIHVEPPADGRAQELKAQLELAARRVAGSKGNPPRLMDEVPSFERKRTNHWVPGTPPDPPPESGHSSNLRYYEPSEAASSHRAMPHGSYPAASAAGAYAAMPGPPPPQPYPYVPQGAPAWGAPTGPVPPQSSQPAASPYPSPASPYPSPASPYPSPASPYPPAQPSPWGQAPIAVPPRPAVSAAASVTRTPAPVPVSQPPRLGSVTARGHAAGAGASVPVRRGPATPAERFAVLLGGAVQLTGAERDVLTALDAYPSLSASQIARIARTADGAAWMTALMTRLTALGFDVVAVGSPVGGEPTYVLRR